MKTKSVTVLTAAVVVCMVLAVIFAAGSPWLIRWYADVRGIAPPAQTAVLICYCVCTVPALIALGAMFRILRQIKRRRPFEKSNTTYLSVISWCCLAVAVACAAGGVFYPPLFLVSASMFFLFLVVRVVCSCFTAAALLQEDNDLTV